MLSKSKSGIKWTTYATLIFMIVALLKTSILTRFLDISEFGLVSLVTFVLGFVNLFMDIGITSAILHKQDISKNEYSSLYWLNVSFSIIIIIILYLVSPFIAEFYNQPLLKNLIFIMSWSLMFSAIGGQFKTIRQKNLDFKYIAIAEIIGAITGLLLSIILAFLGYKIYSLILSTLWQYLLTNVIFFINDFKKHKFLHFKLKETFPFLKIGIYQVGGQVINYFSKDLDLLLIGKFFGVEILGGYSLAKQLVLRPMSVINPIVSRIGAPILAKAQNDLPLLQKSYLKFFNLVSSINFLSYLFLGGFAYYIVLLLYGIDYVHITYIVQLLCVYMFLRSLNSTVGSLVIATGKTQYEFYWNLVVLITAPVPVYFGSQISIEMVVYAMIFTMFMLSIMSWKFLIYPLVKIDSKVYFTAAVPNFRNLFNMLKSFI